MEVINTFASILAEWTVSAVISQVLLREWKMQFIYLSSRGWAALIFTLFLHPACPWSLFWTRHTSSVFFLSILYICWLMKISYPLLAKECRWTSGVWATTTIVLRRTHRRAAVLDVWLQPAVGPCWQKPWNPSAIAVEPQREPRWATRTVSDRLFLTLKYPNLRNSP